MISSIVDSEGILVYTGNDVDTKFATVLARAGHSRVDTSNDVTIEFGNKAKWNGAAWEEVPPSAMEEWVAVMIDSDRALPRWAEDMYDTLPQLSKDGSAAALSSKVAQKKLLRQSKPYKL